MAPDGSATTIALVAAQEGGPAGVETGIRFTAAGADAVHAAMQARSVDADDVLRWRERSHHAPWPHTPRAALRLNRHDVTLWRL